MIVTLSSSTFFISFQLPLANVTTSGRSFIKTSVVLSNHCLFKIRKRTPSTVPSSCTCDGNTGCEPTRTIISPSLHTEHWVGVGVVSTSGCFSSYQYCVASSVTLFRSSPISDCAEPCFMLSNPFLKFFPARSSFFFRLSFGTCSRAATALIASLAFASAAAASPSTCRVGTPADVTMILSSTTSQLFSFHSSNVTLYNLGTVSPGNKLRGTKFTNPKSRSTSRIRPCTLLLFNHLSVLAIVLSRPS